MKYRIKFVKGEQVKFVPHLDMLRLYQRAIRRANLPIAYSNGFNPHQQMSFAQPLSVGVTSLSEYMDIETVCDVNTKDFIKDLNKTLPIGTYVVDMRQVRENEKNSMAAVEASSYNITIDKNIDEKQLNEHISKFLNNNELIVAKKSKKIIKEIDIKPDIFKFTTNGKDKNNILYTFIATGSTRNLKPDLLIKCLYKYMNWDFNPYKINYEREDLYKFNGQDYESLFS